MPKYSFRLTATIEADDLQDMRDKINAVTGLEDVDIEDVEMEEENVGDRDDEEVAN